MNDIIVNDSKARKAFPNHPQVREGGEISVRDWKCIFGEFLIEGGSMKELEGLWERVKPDAADPKASAP